LAHPAAASLSPPAVLAHPRALQAHMRERLGGSGNSSTPGTKGVSITPSAEVAWSPMHRSPLSRQPVTAVEEQDRVEGGVGEEQPAPQRKNSWWSQCFSFGCFELPKPREAKLDTSGQRSS
jgi:hypothetical protein